LFERNFLTARAGSRAAYREALQQAMDLLVKAWPERPYSGASPAELTALLHSEICPPQGLGLEEVLKRLEPIVRHSIMVTHPGTAAHLHCPPVIPALAAEVVLSALNQSMDSFDQAPAATVLEQAVVQALCREAGLPAGADGIFTAGGTQSNYMGLLLARDAYLQSHGNWCARERGLPPQARRFRLLCSEMAHFTVEKSAAQLGLGTDAVMRVAVDDDYRMCPRALHACLTALERQGLLPIAVVATAGTTDFGALDPLREIAALARQAGAWLHVDAAYGGALLFADRLRHRLAGIEQADSITVDFHKLLWQPISCGAFLVRDALSFEHLRHHADYLNPECHQEQDIPDLVTRSVATTRRFDALKLWVSLQAFGREQLSLMIERTLAQAQWAHAVISGSAHLEGLHEPALGCVVFRYRPSDPDLDGDHLNSCLRQGLFDAGSAVIGQTQVAGKTCLKLTCLNPCTTEAEIGDLLRQIEEVGQALEREHSPRQRNPSTLASQKNYFATLADSRDESLSYL
jgi:L-2,4-diaminobutyrate decarboxylase